jgi:hypothetical protein
VSEAWQPGGLLLTCPPGLSWARTHAALPAVLRDPAGGYELFFSPRDGDGRAHVCRARLAVDGVRLLVTGIDEHPVLSPGPLGAFDESGATVSCVVADAGRTLLFYTGWTLGVTVPFYFYAGLAVREAGAGRFERVSAAPVLERTAVDPYLTASPWVIRDEGRYRMWYVSGAGWRTVADGPQHLYHVRYAESEDGLSWSRDGRVCVDFADSAEYAMGRPCVLRDDDRYRMYFAARGDRYRLAYAESGDGLTWRRHDAALSFPAAASWDREMRAYPAILDHGDIRFLLYNGNGYGRTGIGYVWAKRPAQGD